MGHREGQRFYGNRRFAGSEAESITEGFRPYEVPLARKHITAGKIHDDGRVEFSDRADQRKFKQQLRQLQDGVANAFELAGHPVEGEMQR
jgi:hypothetical protein